MKVCPAYASISDEADKSHLAWAFCRTIYHDCGIYKRLVAGEAVPADTLPTGEPVTAKVRKRTERT